MKTTLQIILWLLSMSMFVYTLVTHNWIGLGIYVVATLTGAMQMGLKSV